MSNGMILTNAGREALTLALAGQELHFTRGAIGDGQEPENPEELTGLVHECINCPIQSLTTADTGIVEAVLQVSNIDRSSGLWLREFGLFAYHPETHSEILYAYCNKGNSAGYLEGYDGNNPVTFSLRIITVIDQAQNITVTLDATSIERLTQRVSTLEAAMAGLTPEQVVDAIADIELMLTWNSDGLEPDYSTLTPEQVGNKLRQFRELLTWAA